METSHTPWIEIEPTSSPIGRRPQRRRWPLRAAGVPIAIATDHNPGSSPTRSPLLMLNMACTFFGLTAEEALRSFTHHGARALGLADRCRLAAGLRADLVVWALDHPNPLAYPLGQHPETRLYIAGQASTP